MKVHRHNAGCGELFCFHGAFTKKSDAQKKEQTTPGGFVKGIHYGVGDYRHAVLTKRSGYRGIGGSGDRKENPASFQSVASILQRAGLKPASARYHTHGFAVRKLRGAIGVLFDYDGGTQDSRVARAALESAGFKIEIKEDGQTLIAKNPFFSRGEKRLMRMKAKRGIKKLLGFGPRKKRTKKRTQRGAPARSAAAVPHKSSVSHRATARSSSVRDDVISALVNLGYSRGKAASMVPLEQGGDTFDKLFRRAVKSNPGLSSEQKAIELYRDFHGSDPKKVIRMENTIVESGDYFTLGKFYGFDMSALDIWPFHDVKPNVQVRDGAGIMLCGTNIKEEDGKLVAHHLSILRGDQNLEPVLERVFGVTSKAALLDLGEITNIWYIARKKTDNYRLTHYHHTFGEEMETPAEKRAARPYLMYDRANKKLFIVGGEYSIPLEGIRN